MLKHSSNTYFKYVCYAKCKFYLVKICTYVCTSCLAPQLCPTLCDLTDSSPGKAPLSMGFSRQEYQSGLPLPSPGDLLDPGVKPGSPALQVNSLPSEPPGKPLYVHTYT